jgi:protein-S-isoprenylcysteine O-methyltransferase Ste14
VFRLGRPELILILVIVFFLFGAKRLPEMLGFQTSQSSNGESTSRILTKSFFVALGILLVLFGIAQLWMWR